MFVFHQNLDRDNKLSLQFQERPDKGRMGWRSCIKVALVFAIVDLIST